MAHIESCCLDAVVLVLHVPCRIYRGLFCIVFTCIAYINSHSSAYKREADMRSHQKAKWKRKSSKEARPIQVRTLSNKSHLSHFFFSQTEWHCITAPEQKAEWMSVCVRVVTQLACIRMRYGTSNVCVNFCFTTSHPPSGFDGFVLPILIECDGRKHVTQDVSAYQHCVDRLIYKNEWDKSSRRSWGENSSEEWICIDALLEVVIKFFQLIPRIVRLWFRKKKKTHPKVTMEFIGIVRIASRKYIYWNHDSRAKWNSSLV